jgi:CBS-domain-containing membrane protein
MEFLADSPVTAKVKSGGRPLVRHMRCAISLMLRHDVGRLPVVDRANEKRVVGYLGRARIMAARERYHSDEQIRERGLRKSKLSELQKV